MVTINDIFTVCNAAEFCKDCPLFDTGASIASTSPCLVEDPPSQWNLKEIERILNEKL